MKYFIGCFFIASLLSLSGCVGLAVGSYGRVEVPVANVEQTESLATIKNSRGEGREYTYKNCSVLEYEAQGDIYTGIVGYYVVIPIPLLLPLESQKDVFYFKQGALVGQARAEGGERSNFGYMCGSLKCGFLLGRQKLLTHIDIDVRKVGNSVCD